ncbi:hypothetical protein CEY16_13035 [Halalkalibacillus sediminis]|uniref:Uncharacterized protein n=1 Tax=Halalkalibacillus sediminis TaxID=2018042 RepID=A0A2I0QQY9_9BACI|nr:hypothetical protein [Halalkalibacillus sediminis]PKR76738.1 hypothetical protein CEY16_13035 [Halalkalibacillus sediminis]
MTKKRISVIVIIPIILVSLFIIYFIYFSKPTALPADDELANQINEIFPEANVETIQETIYLDQEHVYVPFISSENNYGSSYWVWESRNWKPMKIDIGGEPTAWTINKEEPSSYIVWNIHPDDKVSYANLSMMRERDFQISHTEHHYSPSIHMKEQISLKEQPYGVLVFPEQWQALLTQENKLISSQNSRDINTSVFLDVRLHFGWTPFNENDDIIFPEESISNNGFINGNIETNFVEYVEEPQLEN